MWWRKLLTRPLHRNILTPVRFINIQENETISFCVVTQVNGFLLRNATFELRFWQSRSTATLGIDFMPKFNFWREVIRVPSNSSGEFKKCFDVTIIGDNMFEEEEYAFFFLWPQEIGSLDQVSYPFIFEIIIHNNDGKS